MSKRPTKKEIDQYNSKPVKRTIPSGEITNNEWVSFSVNDRTFTVPKSDYDPYALSLMKLCGIFDDPTMIGHIPRYLHTLKAIPSREYLPTPSSPSVLEIGTSWFFPLAIQDFLNIEDVTVHSYGDADSGPPSLEKAPRDYKDREFLKCRADLDVQSLALDPSSIDLVLCLEVIEHLEVDPMNLFVEINRVLKDGGLLLLSTPNICSARNVFKILNGYAPHFYMKYSPAASLGRHNIEYAPNQITQMAKAAGFNIRRLWTHDAFEDTLEEGLNLIEKCGGTPEFRGDNIFLIAEKVGPVQNRYPPEVYG